MTQKQARWHTLLQLLLIGGAIAVSPLSAIAQLKPIPDETLGNERSIVSPDRVINNLPSNQINGGARRGANLFHSFREFNIDVGRGAYFTNPAGVTNILTRVTGSNPSQILGTLGVLGTANLFLLNPNGITFGASAQLDIGGSFIASTASSFKFADGSEFRAINPQAPPLLAVNVPIGLQYGSNPGAIQVQGATLQVPDGQTLTLAGGAINIDGANLFAFGGRVELAGVGDAGTVGLAQQGQEWQLSVPDGLGRADLAIGNDAIVNVRSGGGGSVAITARNLTGTGAGTRVRAGIAAGLGTVDAQAGDIDINATETINLDGMAIVNQVLGTGNPGNININTGKLSSTNGTQVGASTFGQGNAGNVTITARDAVSFDGGGAFSSVRPEAIGKGGKVSITTGKLSLTNAAQVGASTFGQGDAGNVTITARDAVSFDGMDSDGFSSGAFSVVEAGAIGKGGNVSITTGKLSITNDAQTGGSTFGQGNAGNVTIVARDAISFTNGGKASSGTFGQGNAGNITITARNAVSFDGVGSDGFGSGAFSRVGFESSGQGGTITIDTGLFSITNGAQLTASSRGQGAAGNLEVVARQLRLDNQGSIDAQTTSGQGGNITLQVPELLLLRRGSSISTTAGTDQAGGDGGNITFNGNFIVAVANENSDISANAFTGSGGRVNINAQGLFGIQFRPQLTPLSDITASSDFGVAGVVSINTPDVDPSRGLLQLPVDLTDASRLIVQTCPTGDSLAKQPNEFIITGRGGLPPTPSEAVNRDAIQVDLVTADAGDRPSVSQQQSDQTPQPSASPSAPIIEAQGLQVAADGTVFLVAASPNSPMDHFPDRLIHCR